MRLSPAVREVVVDISVGATGLVGQLASAYKQLDVEVVPVGPSLVSHATTASLPRRVVVTDAGAPLANPRDGTPVWNGLFIQGGVVVDQALQNRIPGLLLGSAPLLAPSDLHYAAGFRTSEVRVNVGTITNLLTLNSMYESQGSEAAPYTLSLYATVEGTPGKAVWTGRIDGSDIDADGTDTLVNPYDLLSSGMLNDPLDGVVLTHTVASLVEAAVYHEGGHVLEALDSSMSHPEDHGVYAPSAMRRGVGPAKQSSYGWLRAHVRLAR